MIIKATAVFSILLSLAIFYGCASQPDEIQPDLKPPVFKAAPNLVPIEEVNDISYVPGALNVFYYRKTWFYYCNDKWFASQSCNGPWVFIESHEMPIHFGSIPKMYLKELEEQKLGK